MSVTALILAAGKGTRMKSALPKVMHPLGFRPMITYPVAAARDAGAADVVMVIGHGAEMVREHFGGDPGIRFVLQEEQLGTGHAVAVALPLLPETGEVLILCGDVPLITPAMLGLLVGAHRGAGNAVTLLTTRLANPYGYGRVVTGGNGRVKAIVEEKDADAAIREIDEVNSGIYCVDAAFLREAVTRIGNDNAQGEYYLTDIVSLAVAAGRSCTAVQAQAEEVMGVNDRLQLAAAAAVVRRRVNERLMLAGVTIVDPAAAYVEEGVVLGPDSTVEPGASISGRTVIGSGCVIGGGAVIRDCTIGDSVQVKAGSVLEESQVGSHVAVGPMAHLRPGTVLGDHVKIGNFVETKKAVIGTGSKASHLTYLGDAEIGSEVNIGCGTITCNYDGVRKHRTVIEDEVFIGSDVQLVAPVRVGRNSLVAAGTTVTADVPPDSLAIARVPQVNKEGWVLRKKQG